jgi:SEC-C motif
MGAIGYRPSRRKGRFAVKLISLSVWGEEPLYWRGALANAGRYRALYPGWELRLYTDTRNPFTEAISRAGCEVRLVDNRGGYHGLFWRFLPLSEPGVEAVIIRDADSLLNVREAAAVAAWLQSGKAAHVMRDHPMHLQWPILAGLWGIRGGIVPDIAEKIAQWGQWTKKLDDQIFLKKMVWPLVSKDCMQHTRGFSPWGGQPFPPHPPCDCAYVGEIYDPNRPSDAHRFRPTEGEEIRRNSPCPCASGRKFKNCCGAFFWHPNGAAISPEQYVDLLFRKLR